MRRYSETPFSLLNYLFDAVEMLLGLRFLFKLLAANALHPVVRFLYGGTDPLVAPFRGIFADTAVGGSVFEWSVIVSMIMYALVALIIVRLLNLIAESFEPGDEEHEHEHAHRRRHA